jgi:hypothetical protein
MARIYARRHSSHPHRVKKLSATKYIYHLSDGSAFVINEARAKRLHAERLALQAHYKTMHVWLDSLA